MGGGFVFKCIGMKKSEKSRAISHLGGRHLHHHSTSISGKRVCKVRELGSSGDIDD